jgi:hypothetical protein
VAAAELGVGVGLQDLAQQVLLGLDGIAAERIEMPERPWGLGPQQQPSYSRLGRPLLRTYLTRTYMTFAWSTVHRSSIA